MDCGAGDWDRTRDPFDWEARWAHRIPGMSSRVGREYLRELRNDFIYKQFHCRKVLEVLEVRDD